MLKLGRYSREPLPPSSILPQHFHMYSLMKFFRFAYTIIPRLRGLPKNIFYKMIIFDGRGAHLFTTLESAGPLSMAVKAMESGVQYVISLKIKSCSKRWKDLLLRNKFEEIVFFFGGGGEVGGNILADIFVFIYL